MADTKIKLLIKGGKATAGPPLGPAVAPMGVNVGQIVAKLNADTKKYSGLTVPVTLIVHSDKTFDIDIGSPPVSALIKKELGLEKGAKGEQGKGQETAGDLPLNKIIKIAKEKESTLQANTFESAVKQIIGTCKSMGVTIDGQDPKDMINAINSGEVSVSK